nr:large transcriptional regulator [Kibdelosporangium sp. MJ126-NF4]CTQ94221.1 large transcriptional regulator [Kibdelosporangium sp. MJ126-NF4]
MGRTDQLASITEGSTVVESCVVVTGPTGIGRSALLAAAHTRLTGQGRRSVLIRAYEHQATANYGLLYQALRAIAGPAAAPLLDPLLEQVSRASAVGANAAELAERVASTLRKDLAAHGPLTILIDDVQNADAATIGLTPVLRGLIPAGLRIVLAVRVPPSPAPPPAVLDALTATESDIQIVLPGLSKQDVGRMLASTLDATPEAELTERVFLRTDGNPLAVLTAVEGLVGNGVLRVVDRQAFLLRPHPRAIIPHNHKVVPSATHVLLREVRAAGPVAWRVASALAVLQPLGAAAVGLIAESGLAGPSDVTAGLRALADHGVLGETPGGSPALRPPLVADLLRGQLGPLDCEQVHATAARAILDGRVDPPDPDFLPDCLAAAGSSSVDPAVAGKLLLAAAERVVSRDNQRAARWSGAAVALLTGPDREKADHLHAHVCLVAGRADEAAALARKALTEAVVTGDRKPEHLWQLTAVLVRGLCGSGDRAALVEFAAGGWDNLPAPPHWRSIARAMSLLQLGRSADMLAEVTRSRPQWSADPVVRASGEVALAAALIGTGQRDEFDAAVLGRADNVAGVARLTLENSHLQHALGRILFGDADYASRTLAAAGLSETDIEFGIRLEYDFQRGDWEHALAVARRRQADWGTRPPPFTMAQLRTVPPRILAFRGRFAAARQWLAMGADDLIDGGQMALAESLVDMMLGDHEPAIARLRDVVRCCQTGGRPLLLGEALLALVEAYRKADDHEAAMAAQEELERVADDQRFDRVDLHRLLGRALVHGDGPHVAAALKLADDRGQPCETAMAYFLTAPHTPKPADALNRAYSLFGDLDALACRAMVRTAMREQGVTIPGRTEAADETNRYLAYLIADGFGNRQIATLLGTSQKGVEGRITRLLAAINLRSRVELATAVLNGATPWT